jgi:hypothetical protein
MAKSNLLKEAIADAKAVRETAIANAKIALEEAFTPRLQSILSQKLQQEMEDEESEEDVNEEYGAEDAPTGQSSSIGAGENQDGSGENNKQPSGDATQAHTELGADTEKETAAVGSEPDEVEVVKEGEGEDEDGDGVIDDPTGASVTEEEDYEEEEDDLDLESIIRELEAEIGDEEEDEVSDEEEAAIDAEVEDEVEDHEDEFHGGDEAEESEEAEVEDEVEDEEEIDLDEILREMGYGDDEEELDEEEDEEEVDVVDAAELQSELQEAYNTIKSLQGTINEVNLLNAKLLYSNKLFRNYELTSEQKMKVVETLDRTTNVREVKLVFATLAESLSYGGGGVQKKAKKKITESFASDAVKSTAPKKEIINEDFDFAARFKTLANINEQKK